MQKADEQNDLEPLKLGLSIILMPPLLAFVVGLAWMHMFPSEKFQPSNASLRGTAEIEPILTPCSALVSKTVQRGTSYFRHNASQT